MRSPRPERPVNLPGIHFKPREEEGKEVCVCFISRCSQALLRRFCRTLEGRRRRGKTLGWSWINEAGWGWQSRFFYACCMHSVVGLFKRAIAFLSILALILLRAVEFECLGGKKNGFGFFMQNSHFSEPALLVFLYSSQPSSLSFPFLFCLSQAFFPALSSLLGEAKIFFPKNAILEKSTSRFLRGFLFSPLLHLPGLLFSRLYKHLRPRALDWCNVKQRLNSPQQQGVEEEAS